ncbi:MAG TPA: WecB/TagA/CpsF family glycosyltransferase [Spirochaetota bacterium]|nr:WecB/TagA/CpsF family glycosyltransferase [Spirochaetota bacterium]HOL57173.1 WecB/TagA/CpsF family glycosyltransferase [Spirochaetota bacterium]HPP04803.1 WecB/TagA/CpsF family glycosyltransferase [Spirochaetota bacterium]
MTNLKLLGINVDSISEEEIYDYILILSKQERPIQIVLLDTYLLMKAKFNKELANIINSSELVIPISKGIKFGLGFFKKKVDHVYNYFSFIIKLLAHFTDFKKNIYILGGNERTIKRAEKNIKSSFPGIRLMGRYHIHYKKDFEKDLITAIRKTDPALTIISMKRPKQEKWIAARLSNFKSGVFIGVENFIDIIGSRSSSERNINKSSYRGKIIARNPFRIFYYIFYLILLIIAKITGKD